MSTKLVLKGVFISWLMLVLGGCITTDVTVTLNPDGSGTVEYTRNFDRAPEEQRDQIRQQVARADTMQGLSKETIQDQYPEPHFKLVSYENDADALQTRIVLRFNDINALLIHRDTADLGLKALDFKVDGDALVFSVKEEDAPQWSEKYDNVPGQENIAVINAKSGDQVVFSRELTTKTPPADWTGRLPFPGHNIVRTPNIKVFHDYPVVQAGHCEVKSAEWTLRHVEQWSSLELKLNASLPADGNTYIRWENPVTLSGGFLPKQAEEQPLVKLQGKGDFAQGANGIELKTPIPGFSAEKMDALKVRLTAYRATGSRMVNLGPLKPNTEYTVDDLTFKTDDLANSRVGFKATGTVDLLKSTWLETRRGSRFKLKWSSKMVLHDKATMSYWESVPLEGCSLCVELYDTVEPCYIDMDVPTLDLTQRAWRVDDEKTGAEPSADWKASLKAECPELFNIPVPPVEAAMFEDKEHYKTYFKALDNQQIMPAIMEVVDYMVRHNPDHASSWMQSVAQDELKGRPEYLQNNRQQIAKQLFEIYKDTPKEMGCIGVFFGNVHLQDVSQPMALAEIEKGNSRLTNWTLFSDTLTQSDRDIVIDAFLKADGWQAQQNLLTVLDRSNGASLPFVIQLFNDRSLSSLVRKKALEIALKNEQVDPALAENVALDTSEKDSFIRIAALPYLLQQDPFPTDAIRACLGDLEISRNTASALNSRIAGILSSTKSNPAMQERWKETLKPLGPILEDLAQQLKEFDAKEAITALNKFHQLENAQTP